MPHNSPLSLKSELEKGGKANPFWILGPCVTENRETNARIADVIKGMSQRLGIEVVFKASFDKANRTSGKSFRGLGMERGLEELEWVKKQFEIPVLTDVHECAQVKPVSQVVDVLQIPAFLCRQTDLILEACRTGLPVNVKRGQFLDPNGVRHLIEKLSEVSHQFWVTERGVSFGYGRLVVDFASFPEMEKAGAPLIMDITHAVQLPSASSGVSGGIREAIPYLARAAAAVGVRGFFAETHPEPEKAKSDGANAWPLEKLEGLVKEVQRISSAAHG